MLKPALLAAVLFAADTDESIGSYIKNGTIAGAVIAVVLIFLKHINGIDEKNLKKDEETNKTIEKLTQTHKEEMDIVVDRFLEESRQNREERREMAKVLSDLEKTISKVIIKSN